MSDLDELLNFDSLHEAEKLSGKSYKSDEETTKLGFALHVLNSEEKKKRLKATNDSYYGIKIPEFLEIVKDLGFTLINKLPFTYEESKEHQFWYWHPDHFILLVFNTFYGNLNAANMWYCHERDKTKEFDYSIYSSHSPLREDWVCGSHDVREGLRHHFNRLLANGKFVRWGESQFIYSLNYAENEGVSYEEYEVKTKERLAHRPDILEIICMS